MFLTLNQPPETISSNSHQSTKRHRKTKKSTTVSAEMISVPVIPTTAVSSSRKVTYVSSSKTSDKAEAQPTRRVVSKLARFLVTIANGQDLGFQQVGTGRMLRLISIMFLLSLDFLIYQLHRTCTVTDVAVAR
jgi:hypothetical protein